MRLPHLKWNHRLIRRPDSIYFALTNFSFSIVEGGDGIYPENVAMLTFVEVRPGAGAKAKAARDDPGDAFEPSCTETEL